MHNSGFNAKVHELLQQLDIKYIIVLKMMAAYRKASHFNMAKNTSRCGPCKRSGLKDDGFR